MLSIQKPTPSTSTSTSNQNQINILPCKIHHNGPVNATPRHWNPETISSSSSEEVQQANQKKTAYFRGRKLVARDVDVPDGYKGFVVHKTDEIVRPQRQQQQFRASEAGEGEEEEEDDVEIKIAREISSFDKVTVWDHEISSDEKEDVYVKGLNEWIGFAGAIHSW